MNTLRDDWVGRRVVVMGLGRFGGGAGVARFLARRGARVLVTDLASAESLAPSVAQLADLAVDLRLGEHLEQDFHDADVVVVNPAVKPAGNRFIAAAREGGARITSEIRLLAAELAPRLASRRQIIGITGTAGKSTVTAMIGHVLARRHGEEHVHVGGNLGGSLLDRIDAIGLHDHVVLELSSFMLAGLDDDAWSPGVAVVTTFAPNHLDWHPDLADYRRAKQVILRHQQPGDTAILGPDAHGWPTGKGVRNLFVDACTTASDAIDLLTPGRHNQFNAHMAIAAGAAVGVGHEQAAAALADFAGLPHRLQLVAEWQNVRYFNDSKATTPEAATLAIDSFTPGTVHAILGGYDKKTDLTLLARHAAEHCRAVYTIGATGSMIAATARAAGHAEVVEGHTLDDAVAQTVTRVHRGDVVLLSPGCASWDQFENYEQRGTSFVAAVLKYVGEGSPNARM